MKLPITTLLLGVSSLYLHEPVAQAQAIVATDHNEGPAATESFHFKTVPAPRQNAASGAAFTLVDGVGDAHGGGTDVLHDGRTPDAEDQPDANFFFRNGSEGGRVLVDLGKVIPVQEIDTYSWHSDVRAPQVYKLYGSDGSGAGFAAQPHRPQDPALAGWKLIASVDTRPLFGLSGGQYGVGVRDPAGSVGSYRFLLFDVARTTDTSPFGNTFYGEIDVVDRDAPTPPAPARPTKDSFTYHEKGVQLTFTSDAPSFDPKERERLVRTFYAVYPEMADAFNKNSARAVTISIETRYHGVAATAGSTIHVNPDWFRHNPEDLDVVTHEAMHVVQQYRTYDPGWLVEGIADYARDKFGVNNAAAHWTLPDYDPKQSYRDAYRVTARFLAWLDKRVKPGIVVTLDQAMRDGTYSAETWKQTTGRTLDELWADYGKNPAL